LGFALPGRFISALPLFIVKKSSDGGAGSVVIPKKGGAFSYFFHYFEPPPGRVKLESRKKNRSLKTVGRPGGPK
jgi:hypothetical protein